MDTKKNTEKKIQINISTDFNIYSRFKSTYLNIYI